MIRAAGRHLGLAAVCCGFVLLASGCGVGAGETADAVNLRVTDDFGRQELAAPTTPEQSGEDTVMRLLQRNTKVETRYGGGFVQSIDGRSGKTDASQQVDWFYYVNGVLADRGAASWKLRTGERIWWDRHRWDTAQITAVVGSFPAPFVDGHAARYRGALLDCRASEASCTLAEGRLTTLGVSVERGDATGAPDTHTRLIIGPWPKIRKIAPAEFGLLERDGPRGSGVFAKLSASGAVTAYGSNGDPEAAPEPRGTGLIAAMRLPSGSPVWVVTGADEAAVQRALEEGFTPEALASRMAVVVGPSTGVRALPLEHPLGPDARTSP